MNLQKILFHVFYYPVRKDGDLTVIRGIECMRLCMNQSGTAWKGYLRLLETGDAVFLSYCVTHGNIYGGMNYGITV